MEYIAFTAIALLFLLFLFVQGKREEKKERIWFIQKLKKQYGQAPDREYKPERFVRISGYFENHPKEGQIDEITWNDLGMDDIFKRMNYTLSSTGEEYLYYLLHTPETQEAASIHFHEIVQFFSKNEKDRIAFQMLMKNLGTTGKYSLYDYIDYLTKLGKRSNRKDYIMLLCLLAGIGIIFVWLIPGVLMLLTVIFYQIFSYFKIRREIEPYITSLSYMVRLNEIADKVQKLNIPVCEPEFEKIRLHSHNLNHTKRGSFWVFHDARNNTTGNPLDGILVYVTMIFHVDLIFFNRMLDEMIDKVADIDELVGILGYLEAAVCVGMFRGSLKEGYCIPKLSADRDVITLQEGYHPMIESPVKNSIATEGCVLLTGSNASGKSTFLKMTALNVLLAQTIYTVCAQEYSAPFCRLFSSMSLRDSLENGESYYIVEIKAIKRILEAADQEGQPIICFVDEVLRGTNTTERIAASSQILKSFAEKGVFCFAATHDLELTEILKQEYDNYHFEEEIVENDILFNYQLRPGRATTKNAIRLLQLMGYEEEIIRRADRQAAEFEANGTWNA